MHLLMLARNAPAIAVRTANSCPAVAMPNESARIDDLNEAFAVDCTRSDRRIAKRQIMVVGRVRDRRCFVIANDGAEGRDQHQRATDSLIDMLAIEACALNREGPQLSACIAEDAGGMKEIVDNDRPHRVEFEVSLTASK